MILVSLCLAGINCNYKGESKPDERVKELIRKGRAIPICPEQLGGLPTPRSGSRIISGKGEDVIDGKTRVITDDGNDVTENYLKGAELTLQLCKQFNITTVILKQGSPSFFNSFVFCKGEKERTAEYKSKNRFEKSFTTA